MSIPIYTNEYWFCDKKLVFSQYSDTIGQYMFFYPVLQYDVNW